MLSLSINTDTRYNEEFLMKGDTELSKKLESRIEDENGYQHREHKIHTLPEFIRAQITAHNEIQELGAKISQEFSGSEISVESHDAWHLEHEMKHPFGNNVQFSMGSYSTDLRFGVKESISDWFKKISILGDGYQIIKARKDQWSEEMPLEINIDGDKILHEGENFRLNDLGALINAFGFQFEKEHKLLQKLFELKGREEKLTIHKGVIFKQLGLGSIKMESKSGAILEAHPYDNFKITLPESELDSYFKYIGFVGGKAVPKGEDDNYKGLGRFKYSNNKSSFEFYLNGKSQEEIDEIFETIEKLDLFEKE